MNTNLLLSAGIEDSHRAGNMRFFKGVALGFGAGLLLATIVIMASSTQLGSGAADPSGLIAMPTAPFSTAARSRTAPLRGALIVQGGRGIRDGGFQPKLQTIIGDVATPQLQYQQPQYQQPQYSQSTAAQPAAGQFSEEQLAFMRRTGKLSSMQPQIQQPTSAQSSQEGFSEDQLAFMRRRMEDQYSAPHATSWDSPAIGSVQEGVRDGYKTLHRQMFK